MGWKLPQQPQSGQHWKVYQNMISQSRIAGWYQQDGVITKANRMKILRDAKPWGSQTPQMSNTTTYSYRKVMNIYYQKYPNQYLYLLPYSNLTNFLIVDHHPILILPSHLPCICRCLCRLVYMLLF